MKFIVLQNFTYDGKRFNVGDEIPEKFYTFDEFKMMSMHGKINISKEPIIEPIIDVYEEIPVKELVSDVSIEEESYLNLINKEEIEKIIINDLINEKPKENISEKQIKKEEKSKKTGKRKRNS